MWTRKKDITQMIYSFVYHLNIQMYNFVKEREKERETKAYLYDVMQVRNDADCVDRPGPSYYRPWFHRRPCNADECLKEIVNRSS